jgi:osmotically-inducible protein OsmY
MIKVLLVAIALVLSGNLCFAEEGTFYAYVDSNVCARLLLGPITEERIKCSVDTMKEGSDSALVRLSDNMVISVNKQKMIKDLAGKLASVTGNLDEENGRIKLKEVQEVSIDDIPKGEHGRELVDFANLRPSDPATFEQVRRGLAMMPYISDFDFISFTMLGETAILTGWTVRDLNRSDAHSHAESVEGVAKVVNNIEVLPLGRSDMDIRAGVRLRFQKYLPRYFWGSGSDIKIVVKYGDVILLGTVINEGDRDIAEIQARQVFGVFHVFNLLRVQPSK